MRIHTDLIDKADEMCDGYMACIIDPRTVMISGEEAMNDIFGTFVYEDLYDCMVALREYSDHEWGEQDDVSGWVVPVTFIPSSRKNFSLKEIEIEDK